MQTVADGYINRHSARKEPTGTLINKDKQTHSCTCPHTAHALTDSPTLSSLAAFLCLFSESYSFDVYRH